MCTAQVRRLHQETGRKVVVVDRFGKPRFHDLFRNNPRISNDPGNTRLLNGPGARPYIEGKTAQRWMWKRWDIEPGEIYLTAGERAFADSCAGLVMIEPHTKAGAASNKAWPWTRWQSVVSAMPDVCFVQAGPDGTRWLEGVTRVRTNDFRLACAVLAASRACVVPEGGLHHAAAALNVPAVTLWAEFIDVCYTGYETQSNIRIAGEACGSRIPCHGCKQSMSRITVDMVIDALRETLAGSVVQMRHEHGSPQRRVLVRPQLAS